MRDFKVGEIVRLKSGGPEMTIVGDHVRDEGSPGRFWISCVYFVDDEAETIALPPEALKRVEETLTDVARGVYARKELLDYDAQLRAIIGEPADRFVLTQESIGWIRAAVVDLAIALGRSAPEKITLGLLRLTRWGKYQEEVPTEDELLAQNAAEQCETMHPKTDEGGEVRCIYKRQGDSRFCASCMTPF